MPLVKAVQELNEKLKTEVRSLSSDLSRIYRENEKLKNDIAEIKISLRLQSKSSDLLLPASPFLEQNSPNPFGSETEIKFQLPAKFNSALLVINDESGKQIRTYNVQSSAPVLIKAGELSAGMYSYSLIVDGITVNSKQMTLTK